MVIEELKPINVILNQWRFLWLIFRSLQHRRYSPIGFLKKSLLAILGPHSFSSWPIGHWWLLRWTLLPVQLIVKKVVLLYHVRVRFHRVRTLRFLPKRNFLLLLWRKIDHRLLALIVVRVLLIRSSQTFLLAIEIHLIEVIFWVLSCSSLLFLKIVNAIGFVKFRISVLHITVVLIEVVIGSWFLGTNRLWLLQLIHILHHILRDSKNINLRWLLAHDRGLPISCLMVLLWLDISCGLKIFVKLNLRLVNSFCESILLFFYLFKKLVVATTLTFLPRDRYYWSMPPRMSFNFLPIYSIYGIFLKNFLD